MCVERGVRGRKGWRVELERVKGRREVQIGRVMREEGADSQSSQLIGTL